MSQLNSNKPLTRQPQAPVEIAPWIKPKDLWVPMGGVAKNLARDLDANVYSTNTSFKPGRIGNAIQNASTNFSKGCETAGFTSASGKWYDGLSELTIFAVAESFLDATAIGSTFSHIARLDSNANVSNSQVNLGVQNASGTLQLNCLIATTGTSGWSASSFTNVVAASAIDIKRPTLYIQRFRSGAFHQAGIVNIGNTIAFASSGLVPTGTITTTAGAIDAMQMHIGGLAYPIQQSFYGNVFLVGVLPYSISDSDANKLAANPWQIFKAPKRVIYFDAPAASNADLSGAATGNASATGAITTQISLNGASVATATAAGAINQSISLEGSAAAITTASGYASLNISLSGSALASATATGDFGGSAGLSGAAIGAASATGNINIATALSGSATSSASAAGNINIAVSLSGTAIAQALASANLTSTPPGGLSGNATATATATGSLGIAVPLLGSAAVITSASGNLSAGSVPLSGAALSVANGAGSLTLGVSLSGSALANLAASGALKLDVTMSGAALAQALATAALYSSGDYIIPAGAYALVDKTPVLGLVAA